MRHNPHRKTYGLGKTILAYMCEDDLQECLPEMIPAYSTKTLANRQSFLSNVAEVRQRGYAIDREEYIEGVTGIGFPIFLKKVNIFGVIGVVAPTPRLNTEKMNTTIQLLTIVSATVSRKLDEYVYGA